jgi:hypothetical protein
LSQINIVSRGINNKSKRYRDRVKCSLKPLIFCMVEKLKIYPTLNGIIKTIKYKIID